MRNAKKQLPTTFFDTNSIVRYREMSQGFSEKEDLWSWFVLRRISIYFTLFFRSIKATPNFVSWLSVLFMLLSGLMIVYSQPFTYLLAALFYNIGYLFDCVDGELARITKRTSKKGIFIDFLIQAASLPVYLSIAMTLLIHTDKLLLTNVEILLIYTITVCIIMGLLVPISYQLTQSANQVQDPLNKIRNKSFVLDLIAFLTGLPGLFVCLFLFTMLFEIDVVKFYLLLFLTTTIVKTFVRLMTTLRNIK